MGDAGAWGPRIKQGYDTLVQHAVQGIRLMPAKGGNPDLDDVEVARAVVYMANQSGAKFKEPEVPAPTRQAAAPAAAAHLVAVNLGSSATLAHPRRAALLGAAEAAATRADAVSRLPG